MKKAILILLLILTSCKSLDFKTINNYYRDNYYNDLSDYTFVKREENARKKIYKQFLKKNKVSYPIKVIESYSYSQGDFDKLYTHIYFYHKKRLIKAFFMSSNKRKNIEDITSESKSDSENELILRKLDNNEYEYLKNLHKNPNYSVSSDQKIYVNYFDKNLNFLKGYMFYGFMLPFNPG